MYNCMIMENDIKILLMQWWQSCVFIYESQSTGKNVSGYVCNHGSLSVGHYELCRDDIGDLPGSPEHLWLRENANEIG